MKQVSIFFVIFGAVVGVFANSSVFASDMRNVFNPSVVGEKPATFVKIRPGTFQMGSPANEPERYNDETQHSVTISRGFEIGSTEVTQLQWFTVMGYNPSHFIDQRWHCPNDYVEINGTALCPNHPVEQISWNDAQDFIDRLNKGNDGYTYRLPTEAEWEYAARAGTQTAYSFGDNVLSLQDYAWYYENARLHTRAVETKKPNPWGLYDMHGNVSEWVQDGFEIDYQNLPSTDPLAPADGLSSFRGGSWFYGERSSRSANRGCVGQGLYRYDIGVRLVRTSQ